MQGLNFTLPPPVLSGWPPHEVEISHQLVDVMLLIYFADPDGDSRLKALADVYRHLEGIDPAGLCEGTLRRRSEIIGLLNDELARSQFEHLNESGMRLQ